MPLWKGMLLQEGYTRFKIIRIHVSRYIKETANVCVPLWFHCGFRMEFNLKLPFLGAPIYDGFYLIYGVGLAKNPRTLYWFAH